MAINKMSSILAPNLHTNNAAGDISDENLFWTNLIVFWTNLPATINKQKFFANLDQDLPTSHYMLCGYQELPLYIYKLW